ncbi:30S ribosomal protein S19e [archaeon]|nr:30S ribosomal protein S19e [archaeon]
MTSMYDIKPDELIKKAGEELKKLESIKMPDWALFAKTGHFKERQPDKPDWWYARTASILRKVYMLSPVGVGKLRTLYGGRKNRGTKREHFYKASGKIIRTILQQLEKEGFIKFAAKGQHKGRIITPKGRKFLDTIIRKKNKGQ